MMNEVQLNGAVSIKLKNQASDSLNTKNDIKEQHTSLVSVYENFD